MKTAAIAVISPSKNAYSETFIQAHKNLLKGTVHYLYGSSIPYKSDYTKQLIPPAHLFNKILFNIEYKLYHSGLNKPQFALKRYLKKHKIQCVLAEYGTTGAQIYDVCDQLKTPLIVHFHGYDASMHDVLEHNKQKYRHMFSTARYIIGVSQVMMERLKTLGVTENKLIYNTYGPNDAFFEIKKNKSELPLFFGVGRFVDKKAPYYTLIAFSNVLKKYPNAQLALGGEGHLLESSINLSKYLGIEDNVKFPGILTPVEVRKYLSKATAFIQHSIKARDGDMEGTPVGIMEASAAAVPVISTFHAGIPDIIIHEKTGMLCEEHDFNKMAEHMLWIIENPDQAIQMGEAGRKNIKENFSMEKHISKLNEIIEKSVNG